MSSPVFNKDVLELSKLISIIEPICLNVACVMCVVVSYWKP